MTSTPPAEALVAGLLAAPERPFALLRRLDPRTGSPGPVEVLTGPVIEVEHLADVPLPTGAVAGGRRDALALVPFRQIRERGFEVHDDGTPLLVLQVEQAEELAVEDALRALPDEEVRLRDVAPDLDDDAYADVVRRIIASEIAEGSGANFVIRRDVDAVIDGFSPATALSLFRRLLVAEQGAYWTFVVHTGRQADGSAGRTLVGASPEVHVRMARGEVVMNPISGTYRYPATGPDADGIVEFLTDPKEVEELFMVVDEELKMMCSVGDLGGTVHGPYLREMANLAHTEFEIRGQSTLDSREVLRQTMFAATVTGSPLQSACRVIRRFEPSGRGYYAGALALLGRDADGAQTLDSPILIRTADVRPDADGTGRVRVSVGATLVRGSTPEGEVAETHAKSAGVLRALGALPPLQRATDASGAPARRVPLAADPRVAGLLASRRDRLARFWLEPQAQTAGSALGDALVVDAEDTFTSMLVHLLASAGLRARVVRYDDPALDAEIAAHRGLVVLGPGPGDPEDASDPRIARLQGLAQQLAAAAQSGGNPVLGLCLGHQLLSGTLGLPLRRKDAPHQGTQLEVDVFGRPATVGFYNSFTARVDAGSVADLRERGVEVSEGPAGEVVAVRGPGFAGIQFHPESVLTLEGPEVLRRVVEPLLTR
ncbi:anthranilate synthase family protein [Kineococcus rubinsiae]|uniref:anthranilate synthase family protein n=1 Tax=Kineococcus rubinsiae TaxID=2609562 RepID=UPI00142FC948|nr:anthranilate synthase family protein [Kineococcus rubinsiae]NIZ91447.1 phenazine-specific anthranilate synthase component I [Kineococcus rubinsiae]